MDIGIGKLQNDGAVRDAVHIALLPVKAGELLLPGQWITLRDDKAWTKIVPGEAFLGIVDPFLKRTVEKGEICFMMLIPGSISSLRHHWTHAQIPEERQSAEMSAKKEEARANLSHFALSVGLTLTALLEATEQYVSHGYRLSEGSRFESVSLPDNYWVDYGTYTGNYVDVENQDSFFSCSC